MSGRHLLLITITSASTNPVAMWRAARVGVVLLARQDRELRAVRRPRQHRLEQLRGHDGGEEAPPASSASRHDGVRDRPPPPTTTMSTRVTVSIDFRKRPTSARSAARSRSRPTSAASSHDCPIA